MGENVSLSVGIYCEHARLDMLSRLLFSLERLAPDEVCILNTDHDEHIRDMFFDEIRTDLPLSLSWRPFDNYRDSGNALFDMCKTDWMLHLGSDEIISIEMANELKPFLESLPEHVLSVRLGLIDLLDETTCLSHNRHFKRIPLGYHGRIFRKGVMRFEGPPIHEVPEYEGKRTIPFDSAAHPLYDWFHHYIIHLWLYKDFPLMRWTDDLGFYKNWIGVVPWEWIWRANQERIIVGRKWKSAPLMDVHYDWFPWVEMNVGWANELLRTNSGYGYFGKRNENV